MSIYDYSIYDYLSNVPESTSDTLSAASPETLADFLDSGGSDGSQAAPGSSYNLTAGQMLSNYAPSVLGTLSSVLSGNVLGMGKGIADLASKDPTAMPGTFGSWLDSLIDPSRSDWTQANYTQNTLGFDPNNLETSYSDMGYNGTAGLSDLGSYGLTTDPNTGISYGGYGDEAFSSSPTTDTTTSSVDTTSVTTDDSGTSYGSYGDNAW